MKKDIKIIWTACKDTDCGFTGSMNLKDGQQVQDLTCPKCKKKTLI